MAAAIEALDGAYIIDVAEVKFLNSSGITGLSRLVLLARSLERPLVVLASGGVPWQARTLPLLTRLHAGLDVRLA